MEILVVDGQGGRIGQQLIKAIVANYPGVEITATAMAGVGKILREGC